MNCDTTAKSLIMSRPVDSYGPVHWSFSPHYVMFSGWVGDQDPTFDGLRHALVNIFHSAWRNYTNFGSDIGARSCPRASWVVVVVV